MILVRRLLGDVLRQERLRQGRTLRDVSASAQVSLGYISEIERGQKEASSECLAAICSALEVPLSVVLADVSYEIAREEAAGLRIASLAAFAGAPAGAPAGVQDMAA
jgi:transcriptional regulator with XRE-family HTH domain